MFRATIIDTAVIRGMIGLSAVSFCRRFSVFYFLRTGL